MSLSIHVRFSSVSLGMIFLVCLLSGCGQMFQNTAASSPQPIQTWGGMMDNISDYKFSHDGKWLALDRYNGLTIIRTSDWQEECRLPATNVWGPNFSPDGKWLWANSDDGLSRWDTTTWTPKIISRDMHVRLILPDGGVLVSNDKKSLLMTDHGQAVIPTSPMWGKFEGCACSPDGKLLAIGGQDWVKVLDTRTWHVLHTYRGGWQEPDKMPDSVVAVQFSPNGKMFAAGGTDTDVKVWHVGSWRQAYTILVGSGTSTIDFSPESRLMVTANSGIQVWDVNTGALKNSFEIIRSPSLISAEFSPSGQYLVTGREDESINVWTTASILAAKKSQ